MKTILIHAWTVHRYKNADYLPYTHWVYLKEIEKYYDEITLLSPVKHCESANAIEKLKQLGDFSGAKVVDLPYYRSYSKSVKLFFKIRRVYSKLDKYDVTYVRFPIPFGWLARLYQKDSKRIVHYVGDPADTIKNNPNLSWFKRGLINLFFKPEERLHVWGCQGATVYTNGFHIAQKLKKYNVEATPLISSTLNEDDFYFDANKKISQKSPKIVYVGYLNKAKGVETTIEAFALLQKQYPSASLTIVGEGEDKQNLLKLVKQKKLDNVYFVGHIDDRNKLNDILRKGDIFCFASLSEGSPRVILEAMANGINVVSTPVGSLPYSFEDGEDIMFADFNNPEMFMNKIDYLMKYPNVAQEIRLNAYNKARENTIESFLKQIFQ